MKLHEDITYDNNNMRRSDVTNLLRVYNTLEERIFKAHKDTYTYDNFVFRSTTTKSWITCSIHGDFPQCMSKHTKGNGCQKCGIVKSQANNIKIFNKHKEEFKKISSEIHNDIYSYEFDNYKGFDIEYLIYCSKHNKFFLQKPNYHMKGSTGCFECEIEKVKLNYKLPLNDLLNMFYKIHKDKYRYDRVLDNSYVTFDSLIDIYCKECKEYFPQSILVHKNSTGCPKCVNKARSFSLNKHSFNKPTTLYYIEITKSNKKYWKIGITTKTVENRYKAELNNYDIKIKILSLEHFNNGKEAYLKEQMILNSFSEYKCKYKSKDFVRILEYGGNSEIFTKNVYDYNT